MNKESQKPDKKEFANRFYDNYFNVTDDLVRDVLPYRNFGVEMHNTPTEDELVNVLSNHFTNNLDRGVFVTLAVSYPEFLMNIINTILSGADENLADEVDIGDFTISLEFKEPRREKLIKRRDGISYYISKRHKFSINEKLFINSALNENMTRKQIFEEYKKLTGATPRTKSSIFNIVNRLKSKKVKVFG